jgi:hypothetical protein
VAEDVAIEMHHAALVARLRQEIRDALDKAPAGVGNDQLHALEAAVDQDGAETPTSRICPPSPSQIPRISRNPSELTAEATSSETLRTSPAQLRFMTIPSR